MLISPAFAQAGGAPGGDMFVQLMPLLLIFVVFWFFLIRPQQKKAKNHREMVANVRRGDQVVTGGGMLGKVTKVVDANTVQVELAENVRVKVVSSTLSDVLSKGAPVAGGGGGKADSKADGDGDTGGGDAPAPRKSIFSFGPKK
ncbi:MAG: preprotein translocase subunit YajC [Alphaproteobacteria bacterium]|jgi:preprotein translocase subunit YajC|nr:preprotein translocase subunit YajC [Alphaproteobacteria bacterium]